MNGIFGAHIDLGWGLTISLSLSLSLSLFSPLSTWFPLGFHPVVISSALALAFQFILDSPLNSSLNSSLDSHRSSCHYPMMAGMLIRRSARSRMQISPSLGVFLFLSFFLSVVVAVRLPSGSAGNWSATRPRMLWDSSFASFICLLHLHPSSLTTRHEDLTWNELRLAPRASHLHMIQIPGVSFQISGCADIQESLHSCHIVHSLPFLYDFKNMN